MADVGEERSNSEKNVVFNLTAAHLKILFKKKNRFLINTKNLLYHLLTNFFYVVVYFHH